MSRKQQTATPDPKPSSPPPATVLKRYRSIAIKAGSWRTSLTLADLETLVHSARSEGYRSDSPVSLIRPVTFMDETPDQILVGEKSE